MPSLNSQTIATLIAAVLAFVAAVLAAGVSIYNARFMRFAKERWWERKADAYTRIIEALSDLVYYYEEHYERELSHDGMSDEYKKTIDEHWRRGYAEIKRATAVGAFLISPAAASALENMWKERGKDVHIDDWFGMLESEYVAARECLKVVVAAAKHDLHAPWTHTT